MQRLGGLSGFGLLVLLGCGGAQPAPPPPAKTPAASAIAKEPAEKADLSPVAAPQDLFVVGRLKRPGPIVDTLGKWAGLPVNLRTLLGRDLAALDAVVAWDAPVELAVALPAEGRRHGVRTVVSVGLKSLGGMLNAVRERGIAPERILPEVFGFSGPNGIDCAVGPSIGNASARLVCGQRKADVEELFAYATRGLPNENLGNRDLELEFRVEPVRRRYSSEIAGARLLAGFLLRQAELDNPRFDRALADATYALADELVLWVEDTDSLELGGTLDDSKQNLSLELDWKFRSSRSVFASLTGELSHRAAAPPPAFGRLPGEARGAGYSVDVSSEKNAPMRAALTDLADAYLEVEKAGKGTRARARRFLGGFLKMIGIAYVQATGGFSPDAKTDSSLPLDWHVTRAELPAADFELLLSDFDGLVRDRDIWKIVAKHLDLDPKAQPKSRVIPLKGKGVPAGTRALVLTIPVDVVEKFRKKTGSRSKVETKKPVEFVLAVAPDGTGASVLVATKDQKDAAERLSAFFAEGGKRLAARTDLGALTAGRGLSAGFVTLLGLLESFPDFKASPALMPNHGETPVVWSLTAKPGPPVVFSTSISIPAGAFADLPGAATGLAGSF